MCIRDRCFGNRGFMPGELILGARDDMVKAVTDAGYDYIMMEEAASRYGAVETRDEGLQYAAWLKEHEGQYDGVIFCMPIFVDENGAIAALQDAGVPILMQAYPDEIGKLDFAHRRDAYCGKFSVTDVFSLSLIHISPPPPTVPTFAARTPSRSSCWWRTSPCRRTPAWSTARTRRSP